MFAILLFILSSALVSAVDSATEHPIDIAIDLIAILIGFVVIIYIAVIVKSFTGSLRKTFYYMIYGILFQILALTEHILKDVEMPLLSGRVVGFDVHHIFMAIGITFFGIAAYNLRKMMSELNKKGYK